MIAKVTYEQLHMPFTDEINQYLGITPEILERLEWEFATLDKTYVGDLVDNGDGTFNCPMNLSNCNKLPRRVAIRDLTEQDIAFWISLVGEENILK